MRVRPLAFVLASLPFASLAHADSLCGTRDGDLVTETRDVVLLSMDHGHATLVVRRTLHNAGTSFDQAMLHVDVMPVGAVATGLRTRGMKNGVPVWYDGELLEAEAAAHEYQELTGIGGFYPKDPALLSWRSQTDLLLQLFPIDPGGSKMVEYTLEAPTRYLDGRDVLELPRMGTDARTPEVTISSANAGDVLFVGDGEVDAGTTFPLSATGVTISVARDAKTQPQLGGAYASISFAKGRALMHTALELPAELSKTPKEPWVVVALDASKSMTDDAKKAEISAARAYLANLPDAHVQLLGYARETEAWTKGFVSTSEATAVLSKLEIVGKNGSAIDVALDEAAKRLDTFAPAGAARRIVVVGDLRTRVALTPKELVAPAKSSHAIVHLATIRAGDPQLVRDDDDPFAEAPRATGGVFWRARALETFGANAKEDEAYEEWARPVRIDRIAAEGVGLDETGLVLPASMKEGEGLDDLRLVKYAPPQLVVRGEIWSTKVTTTLAPDAAQDRLWSALVFGSRLVDELTEQEQMTLAMKGHAVSPVTSFLAIEPGVRPSTEGLDWGDGIGLGGFGLMGHGFGGGGAGIGVGSIAKFDAIGWLKKALAPAIVACGAQGRSTHVRIETTSTEIVDASVPWMSGATSETKTMRACLAEAAWAIDLPKTFDDTWAVYDVKLP